MFFWTFWVYCSISSACFQHLSRQCTPVNCQNYSLEGSCMDPRCIFSFHHLIRSLTADMEKWRAGHHTLATILLDLSCCRAVVGSLFYFFICFSCFLKWGRRVVSGMRHTLYCSLCPLSVLRVGAHVCSEKNEHKLLFYVCIFCPAKGLHGSQNSLKVDFAWVLCCTQRVGV